MLRNQRERPDSANLRAAPEARAGFEGRPTLGQDSETSHGSLEILFEARPESQLDLATPTSLLVRPDESDE